MTEMQQLKRSVWPMKLEFYASAAFRHRFSLTVDSAGGRFMVGSYPTVGQALEVYKKSCYNDRDYSIHDGFKSTRPELLTAFKRYMELCI